MSETTSWVLSGVVAGLALLSLAATGGQVAPARAESVLPVSMPKAVSNTPQPTRLLASAYFDLARDGADLGFDDWYVRHEITLKGVAAQQGDPPLPEDPSSHTLSDQDRIPLVAAGKELGGWQSQADHAPTVMPLMATLQARYDWWVFLAEAGAPRPVVDAAHLHFTDARQALAQAMQQSRLAAL